MRKLTFFIITCAFTLFTGTSIAQFIKVSDNDQTLNCALFGNQASSNFIDSGNQGAGYSANEQDTITICPDLVNGTKVSIRMGSAYSFPFDIDPSDTLYIYDGPNTSSPLLGAFNNTNIGTGFSLSASFANNPSGCLTILFSSDGSAEGTGWEGNIACVTPPQPFDLSVEAFVNGANPDVFDSTSGSFIDICIYDSILFVASPTFPFSQENTGNGYSQTTDNVDYIWTISDGTVLPNNDSVYYTPSGSGGFFLNLEVKDTYPQSVKTYCSIRVGTIPIFAPSAIIEDSICLGDTALISTGPVNYPTGIFETNTFFESIQNQLIPDGDGNNYVANNNVNSFGAATIIDANSIDEICLEIEHTDLSNLEIVVECPNGTQLTLVNASNASGGLVPGGYFANGIALGDPSTIAGVQGTPWTYCFDMNALLGSFPNESGNLVPATSNPGILTMDEDTYLPEESFGALAGCPIDGNWQLIVRDNIQNGGNDGYVSSWRISFDKTLDPNAPTFNNSVVSEGWVPNPTIISNNPDTSITVEPVDYGYTPYTYEATDDFGCLHDTTVAIYVIEPPVLPVDTLLCDDTLQIINSFPSSGGFWTSSNSSDVSFSDTTANFPQVYFTNTGIYTLYFTDSICGLMDSMVVDHGFRPEIFADTNVCADTFQVTNTITYMGGTWSADNGLLFDNNLLDNPLAFVGIDGQDYTLTFIDDACKDTLTSLVSFYPDLIFSNDTLVCDSLTEVFVLNSETSGNWFSDSLQVGFEDANDTITDVFTSEYGNFNVYFSDNTCGTTDTINITFAFPPITNFVDTVLCDSSYQVINVDSWAGGTWSNPHPNVITILDDDLDNPFIELDTAGVFEFIYTDNQCSISDTLNLSFYGEPQIIGEDTLCGLANEIHLADTMFAGGVWTTSDPANISVIPANSSDSVDVIANAYGTYWVYFTDNHCNKVDSLRQVFIGPLNVVNLVDTATCDGAFQVSGVSSPNGGEWTNPDPTVITITNPTDDNPLITLNDFGTYNFIFEQSTCSNIASFNLSYFGSPSITGVDTVCGLVDTYTGNSGYNAGGTWSTNVPEISFSAPNATTTDISATTFGTYWVYFTENFCNKVDSLEITFLESASTATLQDTILCANQYQVTGVTSLSGGSWTNPSTTDLSFSSLTVNNPLITVNNFGTYTVTYDQNVCNTSASFDITYVDGPEILGNDTTCGTVINLTLANNMPAGGLWSSPDPEISLSNVTGTNTNATANAPGNYWVYYTENSCGNQDSIQLSFATAPVFNLNDTIICDNLFPISGVSTFNGGTWSASDIAVQFSDVNVDNPNINILTPGTYTITFTDDQCGQVNQLQVTLIGDPQITGNPTSCTDNLDIGLTNPFTNGGIWSSNDANISFDNSTADNVNVTSTTTGSYWVYYTENQCNHVDSIELTFFAEPIFPLTDSLICDSTFQITGVSASNGGVWSINTNAGVSIDNPNIDNPLIEFEFTGTYTFTYTDNNCGFQEQVTYEYISPPSADMIDYYLICPAQAPVTAELQNIQGTDSIAWLNGTNADSLLIASEGYYTVELFNECHIVNMGVLIEFDFCGIEVPNVITPNGDGANDQLTLKVGEIDGFSMIILNRWGNVVYESADPTQGWDGTNRETGKPCSDGTYFYTLRYKELSTSDEKVLQGFVTIIN